MPNRLLSLKVFFIISFSLFAFLNASLAVENPIKWTIDYKTDKTGIIEIQYAATIDKGWHLYSTDLPDGGPVKTSVSYEVINNASVQGVLQTKMTPEETFDQNFQMQLRFYSEHVIFTQKLKATAFPVTIKGHVEFMTCDDHRCLPPDEIPFNFIISAPDGWISKSGQATSTVTKQNITTNANDSNSTTPIITVDTASTNKSVSESKIEQAPQNASTTETDNESLWSIFLKGLLNGFIALLTPCVFPMLPITVSMFLKRNKSRRKGIADASMYGLSIILLYVGLGMLITILFGADALNSMATNPIFNLIFFILFVIFAISFFGAFELQLPSSWANYFDRKADNSTGFISILFMAFTLAIVSFSCTGLLIGDLLVKTAVSGNRLGPLVGMTGFALALALPFTIFALFPSLLKALPKSGGWLNAVKVTLGFVELALALKFLSTADLTAHWGILPRELFLVLWIVIFTLLGLYLLGKLRFAHDSDFKFLSVPRLFLAITSLSFALYMVPGLWGAPLKAISAFAPPQATQDFDLYTKTLSTANTSSLHSHKKYADLFHCPHNLDCFFDYDEGMAYARKTGKPVLLDFTGFGCVNCRQMEASVWSDPAVLQRLNEKFVLISLYVDDKTELPASEQQEVKIGDRTKRLKTIGNKWSYLQASRFNTNSQPYYVILDGNEQMLVPPRAYDLNIDEYITFLDAALAKMPSK